MKKLFITYKDGSKITYTMKKDVDHMKYAEEDKHFLFVESIKLQQYPKKDNELIIIK